MKEFDAQSDLVKLGNIMGLQDAIQIVILNQNKNPKEILEIQKKEKDKKKEEISKKYGPVFG